MLRGYDFLGILTLIKDVVLTKVFFRTARIVRYPITLRNKNLMSFGVGFTTGRYCRIDAFVNPEFPTEKTLLIGKNCQINDFVHIGAGYKVVLGDDVLIASRVFISDHNHGDYSGSSQSSAESIVAKRPLSYGEVVIENNVWLGEGVAIMPGVNIGENSIIGANSVVTKDVPRNSIAVGSPAKVVKVFDVNDKEWVKV